MSLYQSPIRPFDPVIQDVAGGFRYLRDNFANTGQDSHTRPPSQDQSMWQALTNIMPITKGSLERRWGYNQFATGLSAGTNRLFSFQRDSDELRLLVSTGGTVLQALNEDGTIYNPSVYAPMQINPVRIVASRSFAYIFNGYAADLKKWNGDPTDGISNIGIGVNSVSSGAVFGPNAPTVAADLGGSYAWVNPNNIKVLDGSLTTVTVPAGATQPANTLQATHFGLTPTGTSVVGIKVDVTYKSTNASPLQVQLLKDNGLGSPVAYGSVKTSPLGNSSALQTVSFGGPTDLWGGIWTTGDLQANSFGLNSIFSSLTAPGTITSVAMTNAGSFNSVDTGANFSAPTSGTTASAFITGQTQTSAGPPPVFQASGMTMNVHGSGYTAGSSPTVTFTAHGGPAVNAVGTGTVSTDGKTMTAAVDFIKITVYVVAGAGVIISSNSAGTVNLTIGRIYYEAFKNSLTGHYSDLSSASASTGPQTNKEFNLTLSTCTDSQVDTNVILATADGGDPSILYLVAEVPASTTTYTDNTTELQLTNGQTLVFTDDFGNQVGIIDNSPPPVAGSLAIKHQGRMWMAQGQNVFFSKAVSDLVLPNGFIAGKYEEAWPADNYFDISEGAETPSGLLSDGTNLYIGTENHVRILVGNDPTNFAQPTIVHPNVGVLNQEVWQLVFLEGAPAGSIWLTPDFRVIGSDFNVYYNIGIQIQNILNSIQSTAAQLCHAALVSDGEFDFYILSVPINSTTACDTHLVYDMKSKRWFVWKPTDASLGIFFNTTSTGIPQWLFTSGTSIFKYTENIYTDNGTTIPVTATTSFMHLGEPVARKVLDDVEVIGDSTITVSLNGASGLGHFDSPVAITTNSPLVTSPFGQLKTYLATLPCRYRYYQFTFSSSAVQAEFLNGYSIRYTPFHTL